MDHNRVASANLALLDLGFLWLRKPGGQIVPTLLKNQGNCQLDVNMCKNVYGSSIKSQEVEKQDS